MDDPDNVVVDRAGSPVCRTCRRQHLAAVRAWLHRPPLVFVTARFCGGGNLWVPPRRRSRRPLPATTEEGKHSMTEPEITAVQRLAADRS
jgi:hypothetical protein